MRYKLNIVIGSIFLITNSCSVMQFQEDDIYSETFNIDGIEISYSVPSMESKDFPKSRTKTQISFSETAFLKFPYSVEVSKKFWDFDYTFFKGVGGTLKMNVVVVSTIPYMNIENLEDLEKVKTQRIQASSSRSALLGFDRITTDQLDWLAMIFRDTERLQIYSVPLDSEHYLDLRFNIIINTGDRESVVEQANQMISSIVRSFAINNN